MSRPGYWKIKAMSDEKIVPFKGNYQENLAELERLKSGGGGGTFDGMEPRIAKLEARADGIEKRLDDIKGDIARVENRLISMNDAQLGKWDVAQVVFIVMAALMAAVVFGPRVMALLQP